MTRGGKKNGAYRIPASPAIVVLTHTPTYRILRLGGGGGDMRAFFPYSLQIYGLIP